VLFALSAAVACAILLGIRRESWSARAWTGLIVMICCMLLSFAGPVARLVAGAAALLAAPVAAARAPRAQTLSTLSRAAALLATAGCLLGSAGLGTPAGHHVAVDVTAALLLGYLVCAGAATAGALRSSARLSRRCAAAAESVLMAAGMISMAVAA